MRLITLLVLMAFPLLEIVVLVQVGGKIGFWWTLFVIAATAILGMAMIVQNGMNTAVRVQQAVLRGEPPLAPMVDSALIVVAGVLLVTPGFIADTAGLLMLVPFVRQLVARGLGHALLGRFDVRTSAAEDNERFSARDPRASRSSGTGPGPVIEGEFIRVDENTPDPKQKRSDGSSNS